MALDTQGAILYLDGLINNPHGKATLTHFPPSPNPPRVWTSFIDSEDFQFSINSEYESPWENLAEGINERINQGITGLNVVTGGDGHVPIVTLTSKRLTTMQWTHSERPTFDITMYFINFDDENSNPEREAVALESLTLPRGALNNEDSLTLSPPGGYSNGSIGGNRRVTGTYMLQMGTWFRAPDLILENAVMTISPLRTPANKPLYCEVNVQLRPYQLLTERDFQDYFIAPSAGF